MPILWLDTFWAFNHFLNRIGEDPLPQCELIFGKGVDFRHEDEIKGATHLAEPPLVEMNGAAPEAFAVVDASADESGVGRGGSNGGEGRRARHAFAEWGDHGFVNDFGGGEGETTGDGLE